MRRPRFWRWVAIGLRHRKGRVAIAGASVALMTGVLVTSLAISLGARRQLAQELSVYGADVIVSPGASGGLTARDAQAVRALPSVDAVEPQLFARLTVKDAEVDAIGFEPAGGARPGWQLSGHMPGRGELLVGTDLAEAVSVRPGDELVARHAANAIRFRVSGVVEAGGAEDRALLVPLSALQRLTRQRGRLSAVVVRAAPDARDEAVAAISTALPGVTVRAIERVAQAEEGFLGKMELLLLLASLVVLFGCGVAVLSTMNALVHERLAEVGLMRALGGARRQVAGWHLAESGVIGLVGGLVGWAAGFAAAHGVSLSAFDRFLEVPLPLAFAAPVFGVLVAVGSGLVPLTRALGRKPSELLREA